MKKNLLISAASILLTLILIELGMRVNLIPNDFYTRMQGVKPEVEETMRVLVIGDSFAQDWGTGSSMYEIIARELSKRGIRVLNLADGGMGPYEYASELKTFGHNFQPDLTILFYYVGNDLTNVQYKPRFRQMTAGDRIKDAIRPYLRRMYLYHFFKKVEKALILSREKDWSQFEDQGYSAEVIELIRRRKINYNFLGYGLRSQNYFLDNILMETDENRRAWRTSRGLLAEIDETCRNMDSELLVVIIPHSTQINDHQFPLFKSLKFSIDERLTNSDRPQTLMTDFCDELGVPCLDLLPYFKERQDEDFFRRYDDHFNEKGDRLAAEAVLGVLGSEGFLY